jgi:twinkle protein
LSIVGDEPCPQCVSNGHDKTGNHLINFEDGNKHCNRCGYTEINGTEPEREVDDTMHNKDEVDQLPIFGIPWRGISKEACEFYGIKTEFEEGEPVATWYPHTTDSTTDGYKRKSRVDKRFTAVGNTKAGELFGQSVVKPGGNLLVITEGEDDACAIWDTLSKRSELEGWIPPVVSLAHGAGGAAGDIANNLEYVSGFSKVILCFDMDDAGKQAVAQVCPLLPERVFVTRLGLKDAQAMAEAGRAGELKWDVLKHAQKYQPDGIINGADTWDRYKHSSNIECVPYPDEWTEINRMTYGFRPGSVITVTSGTGVGKTQFLRELKLHCWERTDWNIADISLEEDVGDSVSGLMSLRMGQRIHLPDVSVSEEHERLVHTELFESGRFSFYDHFGGMDDSNLFNKLRYFGATGHKVIFLDHLSIIVSEYAAEGGERERIDTIMTRLAKIAKELELVIFIVVHLRKEGSGRSFEQGAVPSLDDLRGSGSLKQLSWDVIALSRDQQHSDKVCRNISKVSVLKCRFSGRTGEADYLRFDELSGRMIRVEKPSNYDTNSNKMHGTMSA